MKVVFETLSLLWPHLCAPVSLQLLSYEMPLVLLLLLSPRTGMELAPDAADFRWGGCLWQRCGTSTSREMLSPVAFVIARKGYTAQVAGQWRAQQMHVMTGGCDGCQATMLLVCGVCHNMVVTTRKWCMCSRTLPCILHCQ